MGRYPLDSVKTRMQTSSETSIQKAFQHVYEAEGMSGLYRGIASPLISLTILNTLNFTSYSTFKAVMGLKEDVKRHCFDIRVPLAGAAAGPIAALVSTPFELVKTRMQLQQTQTFAYEQYKNSIHATYRILITDGWRALYLGHGVNTARESVFLSVYFAVYEHSKTYIASFIPKGLAVPLSGGIAGAIGWFISFPLDAVKAHIQSKPFDEGKSMRFLPVLNGIVESRGILGVYYGVAPSILRAFIVSSSRFSAYETTLWYLSRSTPRNND